MIVEEPEGVVCSDRLLSTPQPPSRRPETGHSDLLNLTFAVD